MNELSNLPRPDWRRALLIVALIGTAVAVIASSGCAALVKAVPLLETGLNVLEFGRELATGGEESLQMLAASMLSAAFLADVVYSESGDEPPAEIEGESSIAYTLRLLQWIADYRYAALMAEGAIIEIE